MNIIHHREKHIYTAPMNSPSDLMAPRMDKDQCVFLVIDMQERALPHQHESARAIDNIVRFIKGGTRYGIPVIVVEQNSPKLGCTPDRIREAAPEHRFIEKHTLSCFRDPAFASYFESLGRRQILLSGSETQICVLMTAHDAIERGYDVFVLGDGVTSRTARNIELGLKRMEQAGVLIESTESALFELIERSDDEHFKFILSIIK